MTQTFILSNINLIYDKYLYILIIYILVMDVIYTGKQKQKKALRESEKLRSSCLIAGR